MENTYKWHIISLVSNVFLSLIKISAGLFIKSRALISDGIHSFSDFATDIVALLGTKLADKKADDEHPFGHFNFEYITSIIIGTFIFGIGYFLLISSFKNPSFPIQNVYGIIVTIITMIIKFYVSIKMITIGKVENSSILISSGKESLSDFLTTCVVLFSFLISFIPFNNSILKYADFFAAIVISIFIILSGIKIIIRNFSSLLGERKIDEDFENKIKEYVMEYHEVKEVSDIIIMNFGKKYHLYLNLYLDQNMSIKDLDVLKRRIDNNIKRKNFGISRVNFDFKVYEG